VYSAFYNLFRPLGEFGLAFPLLASLLAIIGNKKLTFGNYYSFFIFWALIIFVLSVGGFMPKSWTRFYDHSAAIRHFAPLVILPLLVSASYAFFRKRLLWLERNALKLLFAFYAIHLLIPFFGGRIGEHYGTLYTITNNTAPIWILFAIWLYREKTTPIASV